LFVELLTVKSTQTTTSNPPAPRMSADVGHHAVQGVSEGQDSVEDELDLRLLYVDLRRHHLIAGTSAPLIALHRPRLLHQHDF